MSSVAVDTQVGGGYNEIIIIQKSNRTDVKYMSSEKGFLFNKASMHYASKRKRIEVETVGRT